MPLSYAAAAPVQGKWCGMPVKHMSKVRIRHLPTGMYLAANSEKAKLEAKRSDMDRRGKMDDLERKRSGAGGARRKDGIMEQEEAPEAPEPQVPVTPGGVEQALRSAVATDADVLHEEGYRLVLTHRYAVPATTWQVYTVQGPDEPVCAESVRVGQGRFSGTGIVTSNPKQAVNRAAECPSAELC